MWRLPARNRGDRKLTSYPWRAIWDFGPIEPKCRRVDRGVGKDRGWGQRPVDEQVAQSYHRACALTLNPSPARLVPLLAEWLLGGL
jgi:hypothetical protein